MKKIVLISLGTMVLTSCTLSFQNVSTHGTATDLVDENQATSPNISGPAGVVPEIPIIAAKKGTIAIPFVT